MAKEHPLVQVNNQTISSDIIDVTVTLLENGLPSCTLIANDDNGKNFLSQFKLYDEITVKFAYEEDSPNWTTIEPTFRGRIIEINPSLTSRGETLSITAIQGECLKQMRVAKEYGIKLHYRTYKTTYCDEFTNETSQWFKNGSYPYLFDETSYISEPLDIEQNPLTVDGFVATTEQWTPVNDTAANCVMAEDDGKYIFANCDQLGAYDEYFTFSNLSSTRIRAERLWLQAKVRIVGRTSQAAVRFMVSVDNSVTWSTAAVFWFADTAYTWYSADIIGVIGKSIGNVNAINNIRVKIQLYDNSNDVAGSVECDAIKLVAELSRVGEYDDGYKMADVPLRDHMTITQWDIGILAAGDNFAADTQPAINIELWDGTQWITNFTATYVVQDTTWYYWSIPNTIDPHNINNFKVKIIFADLTGTIQGELRVIKLVIKLQGNGWDGTDPYLRPILTDATYYGLIPNYVEKILGGNEASQYTLNTDYIYTDPKQFSYINFPYQDAFMCIQDLVRYGTSLHYAANPSDWTGLHWIITPNNQLVIAPVGNHNVYGKDANYLIENVWKTWVHGTTNYTIIVRDDMIVQNFKHEIPLANYVLVAGKFIKPDDESWTESTNGWEIYPANSTFLSVSFDTTQRTVGTGSVKLHITNNGPDVVWGSYFRATGETLDLTKLVSRSNKIHFRFQFRRGGNVQEPIEFVVATDNSRYVAYPLKGTEQDTWKEFNIELGLDVIENVVLVGEEYQKWKNSSALPMQWDNVNYVGFRFLNTQYADVDCWVDDLVIEADLIRGAYTYNCGQPTKDDCKIGCITHYGCRFLTIKDSLAYVTTLSTNDTYDSQPLPALALYELLRNRIPKTSGQIQIALDPEILPGQLVWIKACLDEAANVYRIDRTFRIHEVTHNFNSRGAVTILRLSDDLKNSIPINTTDPYTMIMRAVNPDYQTRTWASLKISGGHFSPEQKIITKVYNQ